MEQQALKDVSVVILDAIKSSPFTRECWKMETDEKMIFRFLEGKHSCYLVVDKDSLDWNLYWSGPDEAFTYSKGNKADVPMTLIAVLDRVSDAIKPYEQQ